MSTAIQRQFRHGTAAQIAAMTPALGEPCWATDTKQLFIGDGVTVGGNLVAMEPAVGTFTPGLTLGGGSTGMTFTTQLGFYTRIADRVLFNLTIVLSAKGSSTGAAAVTGLPFPANAGSGRNSALAFYGTSMSSLSGSLSGLLLAGSSSISLTESATGTANQLNDTNLTNTSQIVISGQYGA